MNQDTFQKEYPITAKLGGALLIAEQRAITAVRLALEQGWDDKETASFMMTAVLGTYSKETGNDGEALDREVQSFLYHMNLKDHPVPKYLRDKEYTQ